jgi:hypothetical protein
MLIDNSRLGADVGIALSVITEAEWVKELYVVIQIRKRNAGTISTYSTRRHPQYQLLLLNR